MTHEPIVPTPPPLIVRSESGHFTLLGGRSYRIGRDPESDIVFDNSRVSWHHAVLRQDELTWLLEDTSSTNGTFRDRERVQRLPITGVCAFRLGHADTGPMLSCRIAEVAESAGFTGHTATAGAPPALGTDLALVAVGAPNPDAHTGAAERPGGRWLHRK